MHLAGAQEDFGEQLHVLLAGLCVPGVEEGQVGEELAEGLVLSLKLQRAKVRCRVGAGGGEKRQEREGGREGSE